MKFDSLKGSVPFVVGGKKHFFTAQIYPGVEISAPGKHAEETNGGDAVVLISDEGVGWNKHPFTHGDLFADAETKKFLGDDFAWAYYNVIVNGVSPAKNDFDRDMCKGIHPMTFLYASQVLSLIEHRRYEKFESAPHYGGRFLPFRFTSGILECKWTATEASGVQRWGRSAVERLEKKYGLPELTKELMK